MSWWQSVDESTAALTLEDLEKAMEHAVEHAKHYCGSEPQPHLFHPSLRGICHHCGITYQQLVDAGRAPPL